MVTEVVRAVGAGDVERVGIGGAGDELVMGDAGGVGPGAGGVDARTCRSCPAVSVCATKVCRAVDVADGQRAGRRYRRPHWSRSGCGYRRRQHRGVVGAEDVDGAPMSCVPSALDHVERVGIGRAGDELVVGRVRGVGPARRCVDRERAVAAGGVGLRDEGRRAVDVADGQRAAELDIGSRVGLGQVARRRRTSTAASLVPRMLMVTEVCVPSALTTSNVSV